MESLSKTCYKRSCETATEYEDEESGDGEHEEDCDDDEGSDIEMLPPPSGQLRLNDLSTVYPPEELPMRFAEVSTTTMAFSANQRGNFRNFHQIVPMFRCFGAQMWLVCIVLYSM